MSKRTIFDLGAGKDETGLFEWSKATGQPYQIEGTCVLYPPSTYVIGTATGTAANPYETVPDGTKLTQPAQTTDNSQWWNQTERWIQEKRLLDPASYQPLVADLVDPQSAYIKNWVMQQMFQDGLVERLAQKQEPKPKSRPKEEFPLAPLCSRKRRMNP